MLRVALISCLLLAGLAASTQDSSAYYRQWLNRSGLARSAARVPAGQSALVLVDMQNDFVAEFAYSAAELALGLSPCQPLLNSSGACFGVREGDQVSGAAAAGEPCQVAQRINKILGRFQFGSVWASGDDHHPGHCSFLASAGGTDPPAWCDQLLRQCHDSAGFTGCNGTQALVAGRPVAAGPFPPHCVRGSPGAALDSVVERALGQYSERHPTAPVRVVVKGLDVSTDSFGVLPYTKASFETFAKAGLLGGSRPVPAALIRSALTWEKAMANATGKPD